MRGAPSTPEQRALAAVLRHGHGGGPLPADLRCLALASCPAVYPEPFEVLRIRGARIGRVPGGPQPRALRAVDVTVRRGIPVTTPGPDDLRPRRASAPERTRKDLNDLMGRGLITLEPSTGASTASARRGRTGHRGRCDADRRGAREGSSRREQPRARGRGHPRPGRVPRTWSDRSRSTTRTASSPESTSVTATTHRHRGRQRPVPRRARSTAPSMPPSRLALERCGLGPRTDHRARRCGGDRPALVTRLRRAPLVDHAAHAQAERA